MISYCVGYLRKMKMLNGIRFALLAACVIGDAIIPKSTVSKSGGRWKTYYECVSEIAETEWAYYVNITINKTAEIRDTWYTSTVDADVDGTWYYVRNTFWAFPPQVDIDFALVYKGYKPSGNCTWYFGSNDPSTTNPSTLPPSSSNVNQSTEITTEVITMTEMYSVYYNVSMVTEPTNDSCLCLCPCQPKTDQDIEEFMRYIINDLIIAKNSTYKAKQRLVCASDTRWISRGIGFVGILVLTFVFGSIIIGDLKLFMVNFKSAFRRINGRL